MGTTNELGGDAGGAPPDIPRILTELAEGRLSVEEVDAVVDWLSASGEDPPPWLVNRAVRIAGQAIGADAPRPSMWRRLVAALVYDNRLQPRVAGVRSASIEHPRLMYQAGGIEIDLEVGESSIAGRLRMLGQVTASPPDLTNAWVIIEGPSGRLETAVDDLGQFALDRLVAGEHRMEIGLTYELIEIPTVRL
ncbi:MAG: hypothetical protein IT305_29685 [Chloroflexi bacterium]|nr:hypothetical protein [Chloroflexota bacterium]